MLLQHSPKRLKSALRNQRRHRRNKDKQKLQFDKNVNCLNYYIPVDEEEAEELYTARQELFQQKGDLPKYACFLWPKMNPRKLRKKAAKSKKLAAQFPKWRKNYYLDLEEYEITDKPDEDQYVEAIQEQFPDFPNTEEFHFVFDKYRLMREFLTRIRSHKCSNLFRKLIHQKERKLAKQLLEYIETDSIFLQTVTPERFDGVLGISPKLFSEIVEYIDFSEENETQERWQEYFHFFLDPRGEFNRLLRIWRNMYLHMLNSGLLQAIIDDYPEAIKMLAEWKIVGSCKEEPSYKMNPFVRVDAFLSRRASKCPLECSGHRGSLAILLVNLDNIPLLQSVIQNGISMNSTSCRGNIKTLKWVKLDHEYFHGSATIPDDETEMAAEDYVRRKEEEKAMEKEEKNSQADTEMDHRPSDLDFSIPGPGFDGSSFGSHSTASDLDQAELEADDIEEEEIQDFNTLEDEEEEIDRDPEDDYRLVASFEQVNILWAAVNLGTKKMFNWCLRVKANPFQNDSVALRCISKADVSRMIYEGSDTKNARARNCIEICKAAQGLLGERQAKINDKLDTCFVFGVLIAQAAVDDVVCTTKDTNFYLGTIYHYFERNCPPEGKRQRIQYDDISAGSGYSGASNKSVLARVKRGWDTVKRRVGSKTGSRTRRFSNASSIHNIQQGWMTMKRAGSKGITRMSVVADTFQNMVGAVTGKTRLGRKKAWGGGRSNQSYYSSSVGVVKHKYQWSEEEVVYRTVLAIDYLIDREMKNDFPHVHYVQAIINLMNTNHLYLDVKRFKKIIRVVVAAVIGRKPLALKTFIFMIIKEPIFQSFFGFVRRNYKNTGKKITYFLHKKKFKDNLGLDKTSFLAKKTGRKILLEALIMVAKENMQEEAKLNEVRLWGLKSVFHTKGINFTKREVEKYYSAVNPFDHDAAEIILERYPGILDGNLAGEMDNSTASGDETMDDASQYSDPEEEDEFEEDDFEGDFE